MTEAVPSLRERNRQRAYQEIRQAALKLFERQGYAHTSVDQIAAAAGVSRRTFFRYFPAKDDVVFARHGDAVEQLRHALAAAPPGPPVEQIRTAVLDLQFARSTLDTQQMRALARVIDTDPHLQARNAQLTSDFAHVVAAHLTTHGVPEHRAALLAGALFGALSAARQLAPRRPDLNPRQLVDDAFTLLHPLRDHSDTRPGAEASV